MNEIEKRQSIRRGLEKLGIDRVRKALPALENFGHPNYCGCFMGRAFGWEREALRNNSTTLIENVDLRERAISFSYQVSKIVLQDKDFFEISNAHYEHDMTLKEEVMIFLAEHGEAREFNPKDKEPTNVCLNRT